MKFIGTHFEITRLMKALLGSCISIAAFALIVTAAVAPLGKHPNVIVIMTDDQGHGDFGFNGNPKIRTPNLDRLARESVRFENFYVMPVCSPTRACLLTGRYNYRTGIVDTYLGRSLMHPDETIIAEMLSRTGYRTGIFGKWHLGDNYPMRPIDRGFQEAFVLKGGGIGQPSDPPGGESYFNPILQHNGTPVKTTGYVSDVITDAAIQFLVKNRRKHFFVYLAFNAPHTPLEVPEKYYRHYAGMNLAHSEFPSMGHPLPGQANQEMIAKVYGMVENIDDNVGRLLAKLGELKLAQDTVVIFLTDNGPQQVRYNSGMLQQKGNVHEGGIRVPFLIRWPGTFQAGRSIDRIAAHIDVTPTVLELCGATKPPKVKFDGVSLVPLLRGDKIVWPDRTLFFQWHRGDAPQLYRAFAARSQRFKLVQADGVQEGAWTKSPAFELYDMAADPLEFRNIAKERPELVESMKSAYEKWFRDVTSVRDYSAPSRIYLGSRRENPVVLTRQDWRGPRAGWKADSLGYWEVLVDRSGRYDVTLHFSATTNAMAANFSLRGIERKIDVPAGAKSCEFKSILLTAGPGRLQAQLATAGEIRGVQFVEVKRRD